MKRNYFNKKILVVLMLILTIFMGTLINVDAEINDSDEDVKILVEDFSTSEVPASFSWYSSNGRSTFFKDGVVTAVKERKNMYILYYYGKNGNLLKKAELTDASFVFYMKANGDYLYVITELDSGNYLYKLDKDLNVIGKILFDSSGLGGKLMFDAAHGEAFLNFTEESILLNMGGNYEGFMGGTVYVIDYNLTEIRRVNSYFEYDEFVDYLNNYFSTSTLNYLNSGDFLFNDKFSAITKFGKTNLYSFSLDSVGTIYADTYVNNEVVRKEIRNEDYKIFNRTKVVDDYIVTVGGKQADENTFYEEVNVGSSYVSDIVLYNLDGELVQTVPVDKVINYLDVSDDKITFSTQVYDGVCTRDKYANNDVGCDILTDVSTYSLIEKRYADNAGNKNNSVITIKNPQTASTIVFVASIICFVACCVGAIIVSIKKQKMIKG